MKQETVFLIGSSGFIGKNLATHLQSKYDVYVFDRYIDESYFDKYSSIKTFQLDLAETQLPELQASPDYIINLVSIVTAERDLALFDGLIQTNLKVLLNLFSRFKDDFNLKLFIQFGSSEEYGAILSPFEESHRESPNSPYAIIKQMTTNTALMLYHNYHFPATVVRPGNLFGSMQPQEKFIPYIINQLKNHRPLNVSPCMQKRDFISIDDFSCLLEKLIINHSQCKGEIINISSGKSYALKDIIEYCKLQIGSHSPVNYGAFPYRENEIMELECSTNKLSSIIGERVNTDLYAELDKYIKQIDTTT